MHFIVKPTITTVMQTPLIAKTLRTNPAGQNGLNGPVQNFIYYSQTIIFYPFYRLNGLAFSQPIEPQYQRLRIGLEPCPPALTAKRPFLLPLLHI
jgi:hypothetical protein